MELTVAKYRFVLFVTLASLTVSGAVTASAASRHTHSSRHLYLYAPGTVTAAAASQKTDSGWQPYAENTGIDTAPYVPDRAGPLSKPEEASPQRAAAIHECNIRARRIGAERDWQAATYTLYGVCMSEHHQRFG